MIVKQDVIDLLRSIETMFGKMPQGMENHEDHKLQLWVKKLSPFSDSYKDLEKALEHYIDGNAKWAPNLAQIIKSLKATKQRSLNYSAMNEAEEERYRESQAQGDAVWAIQLSDQIDPNTGKLKRHLTLVDEKRAVVYKGQWWLVEDAANELFGGEAVSQRYAEHMADFVGCNPNAPKMTIFRRFFDKAGHQKSLDDFRESLKSDILNRQ